MIKRTFDAVELSATMRHDSMRGYFDAMDLEEIAPNARHYCWLGKHGALVCVGDDLGRRYYLSVAVLPEGRGRWANDFFGAGLDAMFALGATELIAIVEDSNPNSKRAVLALLARATGGQGSPVRKGTWREIIVTKTMREAARAIF